MANHAQCKFPNNAIELLRAIMVVRNDPNIYWWACQQRPWRLIIAKTVTVLQTVLDNIPNDDARRPIFQNALATLMPRQINT